MKRSIAGILLLFLLTSAGCSRPEAAPAEETLPGTMDPMETIATRAPHLPPPRDPSYDVEYSGTHCRVVQILVNLAQSLANNHLPPGFRAADAHAALGIPLAGARGAAILETHSCADAGVTFAWFGIYVHPPDAPGERAVADEDWYAWTFYTNDDALLGRLASAGAQHAAADVHHGELKAATGTDPAQAGALRSTSSAEDDQGPYFKIDSANAFTGQGSPLRRVWHQGPQGLLWLDQELDFHMYTGMGTCEIRAGTLMEEILLSTSCSPHNEWLTRSWDRADWTGRLVHAWGLSAEPAAT